MNILNINVEKRPTRSKTQVDCYRYLDEAVKPGRESNIYFGFPKANIILLEKLII